jgi:hypothetical protein
VPAAVLLVPAFVAALVACAKSSPAGTSSADAESKRRSTKRIVTGIIALPFFIALVVFLLDAIGLPIGILLVHKKSKGKGSLKLGPAVRMAKCCERSGC